jgi:hypothetical protein
MIADEQGVWLHPRAHHLHAGTANPAGTAKEDRWDRGAAEQQSSEEMGWKADHQPAKQGSDSRAGDELRRFRRALSGRG